MNEAETRAEYIDPALKAAGWGVVEGSRIRREHLITPGRIEGHGRRGKPLCADYVLEYRNTKLAVVEAKAWNEALTEGVGQTKNYAGKLAVRFAYSTNGRGLYAIDMQTGKESEAARYPTPQALSDLTFAKPNAWRERFAGVPYDRTTWLLEVFPVLVVVPLLWSTARRYPLTTLLYACIFVHALVLIAGGAYTYARVPLGFQIADFLHLERNPYDRIGHFMQGFVPALAAREILLRGEHVRGRRMLAFVVVCIALAVSAAYELIEWAAAIMLGQGADEFLGTQGDPWDTQSDMFMALLGALVSLAALSRLHDRQLQRLA